MGSLISGGGGSSGTLNFGSETTATIEGNTAIGGYGVYGNTITETDGASIASVVVAADEQVILAYWGSGHDNTLGGVPTFTLRIKRDGATLESVTYAPTASNRGKAFGGIYIDNPGAGTYTYKATMQCSNANISYLFLKPGLSYMIVKIQV